MIKSLLMREFLPSSQIEISKGVKQDVLPGYEEEIAGMLNKRRVETLGDFFTNPTGRVTAIKPNSRDITSAILTARLSRAGERDVTELFIKEFLNKTGEEVGDRILNEFGDDSVREDASAYVFVRDVSVLTSIWIFRHPQLTGIEASTRYINWGELSLQDFAVWPENVMNDPEAEEAYMEGITIARDAYKFLYPKVWDYFVKVSPDAPKKAIKGAVCDALRGLLPLGVKTNFGLHATHRTFTEIIMDGRASDFSETAQIANEISCELDKVNKVFNRVVDGDHGRDWTEYRKKVNTILKNFGGNKISTLKPRNDLNIEVEILNQNWAKDLLRAALVSMHGERALLPDDNLYTEFLTYNSLSKLLTEVGNTRTNRRHKIPDFINAVVTRSKYQNLSFGAYKDLNRHRFLLYKSQPDFSGNRGYVIPEDIQKIGSEVERIYKTAQDEIHERMLKLEKNYPEEYKLLLTHGTKTSFETIEGAGEDFWIEELRSIPSGNPEYREIAVKHRKSLIEAATALYHLGSFVNEEKYQLGRVEEATRADLRKKQNDGTTGGKNT